MISEKAKFFIYGFILIFLSILYYVIPYNVYEILYTSILHNFYDLRNFADVLFSYKIFSLCFSILFLIVCIIMNIYWPSYTELDKSSYEYNKLSMPIAVSCLFLTILVMTTIGSVDISIDSYYLGYGYMMFKTVLFAPIVEETLYRRLLYNGMHKFTGAFSAALISSILFSLAHYATPYFIDGFFVRFVYGMILCMAYTYTRNIWTAIYLHMMINYIAFINNNMHDFMLGMP